MENKEKILIIDDETAMHSLFRDMFKNKDYKIFTAVTGGEGISMVRQIIPSLVILDLNIADMNGEEVLKTIKDINKDVAVIVVTGLGTVETAVKVMRIGASDYIVKPFRVDEFNVVIERALNVGKMAKEITYLRSELKEKYRFASIIGKSEPMNKIYETIQKVSQSISTVLIQGESGTGKELVARAVHYNSNRGDKPFIAVNCAALPDGLLESELFGYEKGAFTGAFAKKEGKFQLANHGTILLDEISELSPILQAKLLRVLQEKEIDPIGGKKPIKIDVRIIATTNQSLEKMIENRKFRDDLFYRLNVVSIYLPPLRERKDDIQILIQHFLQKYNKENNKNVASTAKETMDMILSYNWPGNVRELEHMVEKAVVMGDGDVILPEHLPLNIYTATKSIQEQEKLTFEIGTPVEEVEKKLLLATLKKTNGNKIKAAQMLKLSSKTLIEKLDKYKTLEDLQFAQ